MESDAPETEGEILRRAAWILADQLPARWNSELILDLSGNSRVDALIQLRAPDGNSVTLVVEAKRVVEGRDVAIIRERLERSVPAEQGLVAARYLSNPVRARLKEAGLSYVDATGNIRISIDNPGLFVSSRGADRDPWRGPGRPRGSLKGEPAARAVRAIADFSAPWLIRDLVEVARISTGAAYRVAEYLERDGLATRASSRLTVSDWPRLLRRWSDDYGFVRNGQTSRWIAPRGLIDLMKRMAESRSTTKYVLTGTLAAAEWAAYAPARSAMIYVANAAGAADEWGLRRADTGANVMISEPEFDIVFERSRSNSSGVEIAAPTQVVVDLMTGPGRSASEAEELLEWMVRHEQSWRY